MAKSGKLEVLPGRVDLSPENIPDDLRRVDRWVLWKYELVTSKSEDQSRWTKRPYQINGRPASHSNAETWSTFDSVLEVFHSSNLFHGVGFVMGHEDLVAWDLDHVLNPKTLYLVDWAQEIVNNMNSYTEITPSGEGIRIICRGPLPQRGKKSGGFRDWNNGKDGGLECYSETRYVTMTGNHWPASPMSVEARDTETEWHRVFEARPASLKTLFKNELIQKLWNGEWKDILKPSTGDRAYPSQSEADLALVRQLVISTEGDAELVDKLFRDSKLMRPKWDETGHFGDAPSMSYGQHTIDVAMKSFERSFNLTDTGNAKRFSRILGDRVRYCQGTWYIWDGVRLVPDRLQKIYVLADEVVRELLDVAQEVVDDDRRKAVLKHAKLLEARGQVESMMKLAQARHPVPVLAEDLDASDHVFVCSNHTLERGRIVREHRFEDMMTKMSPVDYRKGAKAPRWVQFLEEIFPDPEVRLFAQKAVGYSMTGHITEQKFFFCYGAGQNGKSTFFEMMAKVFGEYFTRIPSTALMMTRNEQHPTALMTLKGARFALASEIKQGRYLNEELMKALTGEGQIQARAMHQDFMTFRATSKLWIMGNFKPQITASDYAIWRRVVQIPFTVTIPEDKKDKDLWSKLYLELEGILAWCVEGWRIWEDEGLALPAAVTRAIEEYREEMDQVYQFVMETCVEEQKETVIHSNLYAAYVKWSEKLGERPMSSKAFSSSLIDKKNPDGKPKFSKFRGGSNVLKWSGLTLRKEHEVPEDRQTEM